MRKPEIRAAKAALLERDGDVCWICRKQMVEGDRTLDHIIPRSRGGSDEMANLRLAHAACNRRRGNAPEERTLYDPFLVSGMAKREWLACDRQSPKDSSPSGEKAS